MSLKRPVQGSSNPAQDVKEGFVKVNCVIYPEREIYSTKLSKYDALEDIVEIVGYETKKEGLELVSVAGTSVKNMGMTLGEVYKRMNIPSDKALTVEFRCGGGKIISLKFKLNHPGLKKPIGISFDVEESTTGKDIWMKSSEDSRKGLEIDTLELDKQIFSVNEPLYSHLKDKEQNERIVIMYSPPPKPAAKSPPKLQYLKLDDVPMPVSKGQSPTQPDESNINSLFRAGRHVLYNSCEEDDLNQTRQLRRKSSNQDVKSVEPPTEAPIPVKRNTPSRLGSKDLVQVKPARTPSRNHMEPPKTQEQQIKRQSMEMSVARGPANEIRLTVISMLDRKEQSFTTSSVEGIRRAKKGTRFFFDKCGRRLEDADSVQSNDEVYEAILPIADVTGIDDVVENRDIANPAKHLHNTEINNRNMNNLLCYLCYYRMNGPNTADLARALWCYNFLPFDRAFQKLIHNETVTKLDLAIIIEFIRAISKEYDRDLGQWGKLSAELAQSGKKLMEKARLMIPVEEHYKETDYEYRYSPRPVDPERVSVDDPMIPINQGDVWGRRSLAVVKFADETYHLYMGLTPKGEYVYLGPNGTLECANSLGKQTIEMKAVTQATVICVDNSGTMYTSFDDDNCKLEEAANIVNLFRCHASGVQLPSAYSVTTLADDPLQWTTGVESVDIEDAICTTPIWGRLHSIAGELSKLPERVNTKRILLITDGADTGSEMEKATVLSEMRNQDIIVDVIILSDVDNFGNEKQNCKDLIALSRMTNGVCYCFTEDNASDISNTLEDPVFIDPAKRRTTVVVKEVSPERFASIASRGYDFHNPGISLGAKEVERPKILTQVSLLRKDFKDHTSYRDMRIIDEMIDCQTIEPFTVFNVDKDINKWIVFINTGRIYWDIGVQFPGKYPDNPPIISLRQCKHNITSDAWKHGQFVWSNYNPESASIAEVMDAVQQSLSPFSDIDGNSQTNISGEESPFAKIEYFTDNYDVRGDASTAKPVVIDDINIYPISWESDGDELVDAVLPSGTKVWVSRLVKELLKC